MSNIGYPLTSPAGVFIPEHTSQHHSFYMDNKWWTIGDDESGNDFFLYVWDGILPSTPGQAEGHWAKATTATGFVNISTENLSVPDVYWDGAFLHILVWNRIGFVVATVYQKWSYAGGIWTNLITSPIPNFDNLAFESTFTVDSMGVLWVVYLRAATFPIPPVLLDFPFTVESKYFNGAWFDGPTFETTTQVNFRFSRPALGRAIINNIPCSYVIYATSVDNAGGGDWKFAYRQDTDPLNMPWATTIFGSGVDDHVCTASLVRFGAVNSTIFIAIRDGASALRTWLRLPDNTFSPEVFVQVDQGRQHTVIDATNEIIYLLYGVVKPLRFRVSPLTGLNWSQESSALDAVIGGLNNGMVPSHNVTSTTGLLWGAGNNIGGVWWNWVPIAPAIPVILTFTASPDEIANGNPTRLYWTTDALTVDINGVLGLPPNGNYTFHPSVTTTFTLTAHHPLGGTATQDLEVIVNPADGSIETGLHSFDGGMPAVRLATVVALHGRDYGYKWAAVSTFVIPSISNGAISNYYKFGVRDYFGIITQISLLVPQGVLRLHLFTNDLQGRDSIFETLRLTNVSGLFVQNFRVPFRVFSGQKVIYLQAQELGGINATGDIQVIVHHEF